MKRKRAEAVSENRIVAHIDLDCFYVQVERSINPSLKGKAVGVAQYNPFGDLKSYSAEENRIVSSGSLIAVSYEARARGVKRNMRGAEAKKVCPEMILVQVPTSHGKADLTIYRDASARILTVLCSKFTGCIVERSSIDEVYLDVTAEASKWLEQADSEIFLADAIQTLLAVPSMIAGDDTAEVLMSRRQISKGHTGTEMLAASYNNPSTSSHNDTHSEQAPVLVSSWFARPSSQWSTEDKLMLCGALVVNQLRRAVFDELGFTCSAGIANNKMLAKLSSAMHKPNKQTLAPACVIPGLMKDLPYSRIQGLGGKLGTAIETLYGEKVRTMGQILATPKAEWARHFGDETAAWLHNVARGIDLEPVQNRSLPISIGCSKSFRSTMMLTPGMIVDGTVLHWITELAKELQERVTTDTKVNSRIPRNLHCGASVKIFPNGEIPTGSDFNSNTAVASGASNTNGSSSGNINNGSGNNNNINNNTTAIDPEDVVANWHEQAGFSLSKICPMQSLNGNIPLMARTAFQMLVRTILEHPKFTAVYGSNVSIPHLSTIMSNTAAGNGNSNNHSNSNNSGSSGTNSNMTISSPTKLSTGTTTDKSTLSLPTGWAITGISLGATNFQTIESGASSIRSYFGTTVKGENTAKPTDGAETAAVIDTANNLNSKGSSSESEDQTEKALPKSVVGGGIRDLFARQSATKSVKEFETDEAVPAQVTPMHQPSSAAPVISSSVSIRDLLLKQPGKLTLTSGTICSTSANIVYDLTNNGSSGTTHSASSITTASAPATSTSNDIRHWVSRRGPPLDTVIIESAHAAGISTSDTGASEVEGKQEQEEEEVVEEFLEGGDVIIEEVSSQSQSLLEASHTALQTYNVSYTSLPTTTEPGKSTWVSSATTISNVPASTCTSTTTSSAHSFQPRSMGDIDYAVFLTLPAEIQREIELTMKLRAHTQLNRSGHNACNNNQKVNSAVGSLFGTSATTVTNTKGSGAVENDTIAQRLSTKKEDNHQPESMMDVDSAVFLSLPPDIQREIELTMKLRQQRRNSGASTHIHRHSKGKK